ncbi:hypothetical protein CS022_08280 [Veronia nyctiphanis]|uniref:Enoyl reductase (ER) domain-containing protein n=1 Tax=Veronia nyctiphanis TaxID=1278244 RepID=A0A4Q0YRC0_9GAMM|nr:NADP-dependent oxidoreductase [Veronia nyctiphanis]RXJ73720.1 hypothetical protein CS022_08280 [Veronia nyctiphanis]
MKAWQITSPSGLEQLHLVDTPPPEVSSQDVLINVEAVALNPFDFKLANWGYATWDYPKTLGTDFAGTVTECGDAVKHFTVGDRVCCFADPRRAGAFAEKIAVNQHHLARIPDGVDFGSAAAITSSGLTAWQTLHKKLCLSAGSSLVINGAAGGVGGYLIQLAKAAGLTVIGIDEKKHLDRMLSLGADITLDYRNDNIAMAVMQATEGAMADA